MKIIYLILGLICFGLGAAGVVLPILPTAPFFLVSAFCFARGSKRVNNWFLSTKLYQRHLDSFVKSRSMTLKTKLAILIPVSVMLAASFFMMDSLYGRAVIVILIIVKYYYFIFRIKTISPKIKTNKKL